MGTRGTLRFGLAAAAFFLALTLVVWRQSRALEVLRALDGARGERATLESERVRLLREIEELESRPRIVAVAGERLGLRPPAARELVILQLPGDSSPARERASQLAIATGGER